MSPRAHRLRGVPMAAISAVYADRYRTRPCDGARRRRRPRPAVARRHDRRGRWIRSALDYHSLRGVETNSACRLRPTRQPDHGLPRSDVETWRKEPAEADGARRAAHLGAGRSEAHRHRDPGSTAGRPATVDGSAGHARWAGSRGDGSAFLALSGAYTGRPARPCDNQTDAFYAIGCLDSPAPPTVAAVQKLAARAAKAAPVFGASNVWLGLPCTFWPAPSDRKVGPIRAAGAPPILVIGTTDDPATPYKAAQALAHELESGHLLTYVGEGHTAYGRGDACIDTKGRRLSHLARSRAKSVPVAAARGPSDAFQRQHLYSDPGRDLTDRQILLAAFSGRA